MNRFEFEEVLFSALYAPMREAYNRLEADTAEDPESGVDTDLAATDPVHAALRS